MALDFLAGLVGGAAGVLVGHPFDTVKVRLQTQSPANPKYKGTVHCFSSIIKQESTLGLYKGISSPLAGLAFINAIVFGVYGNCLKKFTSDYGNSIRNYFYAGAAAGLIQSVICAPMELSKLRLQLQGQGVRPRHVFFYYDPPMHYTGPLDCLVKVFKHQGVRGVMKGLPITVARDMPCFGLYFASYEWLVRKMSPQGPEYLDSARLLFAGGAAGMISWLFLYPIDVVKSRFQADESGRYRNVLDCVIKSHREEGIRVFTQGLGSTMLRAFPTNAVTFFTVEWVFRLANGYLVKNIDNTRDSDTEQEIGHREQKGTTSSWLFFALPDTQTASAAGGGATAAVLESAMINLVN